MEMIYEVKLVPEAEPRDKNNQMTASVSTHKCNSTNDIIPFINSWL